ncbi:hypothetical protein C2H96_19500 [Bacillus subtilis]|uniref:DNA-processing protein DprA n=1 Tax=Bacillus subtilis TaxID=1423 RepID=UPI00201D1934|nr:DNA-processing protein DprA [Bacillus subtilis]UQZ56516.1 hypothetical protein C2H96_19500 [Bacillus subtilis]UQZ65107.1 hypothetical protein C2H97_00800 [Bacillus subtilis PY79]UQZ69532.1 hypothetical protein C2I05_02780 [Bacillus subtilis]
MSTALWIALKNVEGMGIKTIKKLYLQFPKLSRHHFYTHGDFLRNIIKNSKILDRILDKDYFNNKIIDAENQIKYHNSKGIEVVDIASDYYPRLLRFIDDPPVVLYCMGNLELLKDDRKIAIVGTRKPTDMGYKAAMKISNQFCKRDFIIVSGLAIGIDTAGHIGALNSGGKTIAVLAGSLDKIYPKVNTEIAASILNKHGLLISETPLGENTYRNSFVKRDRIQSGISLGVCPVQTPLKGGTQHTINFAQNQDRLLFCPEPLESKDIEATQGIYYLLEKQIAKKISKESDYGNIIILLAEVLNNLIEKNNNNPYKMSALVDDCKNNEISGEQLSFFNSNKIDERTKSMEYELDSYLLKIIEVCKKLGMNEDQLIKRIKLLKNK